MDWHVDPVLNKAVRCNAQECALFSAEHHFASKEDAEEAIAMTKAFNRPPSPSELVFSYHRSELTGKAYLETSFITALGELAVITAEEKDGYALGTILIGNRLHGVANVASTEDSYVDRCAKLALNVAAQDFKEDLWPDQSVMALYESISKHSSAKEINAPGGLILSEASQSGVPQLFKGRTAIGTPISISVAYGYAVAQADLKRSSKLIYEASVPTPLFCTDDERNLFAAKAFGELVAAKV
jgi:hypothetical protein